ncbi:hypothetical protein IEO21_04874 [Rhodonia placenta]|uniref:Aprataxin C2HE/C2H2/C2HC zinc finger domain-containing protein n=1 Tax=Rhodonia placenta TaxID=104341 RepID=A0A8H7P3C0_9APHY|nr:hypothetical protein IEO21_04874 [Postia placenta]
MSHLTILRSYAQKKPEDILPSVRLLHSEHTITIFDKYEKAIFHFLVLPRVKPPYTLDRLRNLRSLLLGDREQAKQLLERMAEDAKAVQAMIEDEMMKKYGFKWDIWMGFHAIPSLPHLHLHIISSDLCSNYLKTKKHYNSFHPGHGFFIKLQDVLEWFEPDTDPRWVELAKLLVETEYGGRLKESFHCWRCDLMIGSFAELKEHLQADWEKECKRKKAAIERKRIAAEKKALSSKRQHAELPSSEETTSKKQRIGSPSAAQEESTHDPLDDPQGTNPEKTSEHK